MLTTVSHLNNFLFDLKYEDAAGNQTRIGTTGYHKFYSQERGWISAHKLRPQEELLSPRGTLKVISITRKSGTHRVYNLTVEQQHVYYVGDLAALVQNNGCGGRIHGHHSDPKFMGGKKNQLGRVCCAYHNCSCVLFVFL